jgi:catechol 2,3-dioxygenase-like lactoylglutathione lyase family enzyme
VTNKIEGMLVAFLSVSQRERALTFYRDVLGFEVRSSDDFGDFVQLEGALLRITVLPDFHASRHPVLGWNVRDVVATVRSMRDRGVVFTVYEGMGQDDLGIWTAPDGQAKVAWFADPDGNVLSLSQA